MVAVVGNRREFDRDGFAVRQLDDEVAVFVDGDAFDADALRPLFALFAFITLRALFTLLAFITLRALFALLAFIALFALDSRWFRRYR